MGFDDQDTEGSKLYQVAKEAGVDVSVFHRLEDVFANLRDKLGGGGV